MRAEEFRRRVKATGFATIGQRLLRARLHRELSVRDLADLAQVSKNTVTRAEKGMPIQAETLRLLAIALMVKPAELVDATFELTDTLRVARKETGRWFDVHAYTGSIADSPELPHDPASWGSGVLPFCPLASRDPGGKFNPNLLVLTQATDRRSHRGEEFVYVLQGSVRVAFDQRSVELSQGDSLYFWAGESHRYEPLDSEVRLLSIVLDPFPDDARALQFEREDDPNPGE